MADTKTMPVSGVAFPSARLIRQAETLHGRHMVSNIGLMLEDSKAVDVLAGVLDRALEASLTKDGRLDLRVAATHVMKELRRNQR